MESTIKQTLLCCSSLAGNLLTVSKLILFTSANSTGHQIILIMALLMDLCHADGKLNLTTAQNSEAFTNHDNHRSKFQPNKV